MEMIVIFIVTGSTNKATRKNNKVVCVPNLFPAGIQLFLFQLVVNSLASTILHVFFNDVPNGKSYTDAHSYTGWFYMMIWKKGCNYVKHKTKQLLL